MNFIICFFFFLSESNIISWMDIKCGQAPPPEHIECFENINVVARWNAGNKIIAGKFSFNHRNFYGVDEDHSTVLKVVTGTIEILTSSAPSRLKWVSFAPGNMPSNAVVGGQRSDGDKLYVARGNGRCGYYDPTGEHCAYVEYYGVHSYATFEILTAEMPGKMGVLH